MALRDAVDQIAPRQSPGETAPASAAESTVRLEVRFLALHVALPRDLGIDAHGLGQPSSATFLDDAQVEALERVLSKRVHLGRTLGSDTASVREGEERAMNWEGTTLLKVRSTPSADRRFVALSCAFRSRVGRALAYAPRGTWQVPAAGTILLVADRSSVLSVRPRSSTRCFSPRC